jgi:hypothetical protein
VARRVRERRAKFRDALVVALHDWFDLARRYKAREADWLAQVMERADPDPWRQQLRLALTRDDQAALDHLADAPEFGYQRPQTILLLAEATSLPSGL